MDIDTMSDESVSMSVRYQDQDVDRIGDILRRVREHREEDIESISQYLCIRPNFLFALEESHYEELPADAYVIGFLRSYASYLGLDGRGAIDQYRREMAGRRRKPQLSMPQPMPEGRAPTITVLIGAALAALLVYGIWYGLSSPDHTALEKPVVLPLTQQDEEPSVLKEVLSEESAENAAQALSSVSLSTQTATSDGIVLPVPGSNNVLQPVPSKETAATSNKKTTDSNEANSVKKDEEKKEPPAPSAPASPDNKKEQPKTEKPTPAEKPASFGSKKKTRLTVMANRPSWVLVTDSKGNTVFDRTLKVGETYNVPLEKELKLTTGDAESLSFVLNGVLLPKLLSSKAVVRAISLDPDKLEKRLTSGDSGFNEVPAAR